MSKRDIVLFIGALVMAYGYWLAWAPLGIIVGGGLMMLFAVIDAIDASEGRQ